MNRSSLFLRALVVLPLVAACSSSKVPPPPNVAEKLAILGAPLGVRAGDVSSLTLTAYDKNGSIVPSYRGVVSITCSGQGAANAAFPAGHTFSADDAGVFIFPVTFTTVGAAQCTASDPTSGTLTATTTSVAVRNAPAAQIAVLGVPTASISGDTVQVNVALRDRFNNLAADFVGMVHVAQSDATGGIDVPFVAADGGQKTVALSLVTQGTQSITAQVVGTSMAATAAVSVRAGRVRDYRLSVLPGSVVAGTSLALGIEAVDRNGNVVRNYAGTAHFTSNDPADQVPPDSGFTNGAQLVSLRFTHTGVHRITVAEVGSTTVSHVTNDVTVTPADAHFVVVLPADANAGALAAGSITVRDLFDNLVSTFAGTVALTNTDAAATGPASVVFAGTENGTLPLSVTFNTLGTQTLTATSGAVTGSASTQVHGLVYTDPSVLAASKVRLVLNQAASNASVVQLDLVVSQNPSPGTTSAYSAGMNLPVDTSRAVADAALLVEGNALNLGQAPKAVGAVLSSSGPFAGVLFTGVSQKGAGAGAATADAALPAGARLYSVRLRLNPTAAPGALFDGTGAIPNFRAAVRDRLGNDTISQAEFAIGRLEVR